MAPLIAVRAGVPPKETGYDAFVEMSQAIMAGRTPVEQKQTVLNVLNSLLPSFIPWACRKFFKPTQLTAFTCAYFAHIGFEWVRKYAILWLHHDHLLCCEHFALHCA